MWVGLGPRSESPGQTESRHVGDTPPDTASAPPNQVSLQTPPGNPEWQRVLRSARRGHDDAWDLIYRWLAPQVLGYLRSARLGDEEDVLGDVFLDVARRIGEFAGDAAGFRAWVFTIARARRVDEIRRRVRRREDRFDTQEHEVLLAGTDVEAEVLGGLILDDLLSDLEHLTEDQAEVLVLRMVSDLTAREVAEATGRTVGSVEQLQHRALVALRDLLRTRKELSGPNDYQA